jgi:hypothetical protein
LDVMPDCPVMCSRGGRDGFILWGVIIAREGRVPAGRDRGAQRIKEPGTMWLASNVPGKCSGNERGSESRGRWLARKQAAGGWRPQGMSSIAVDER